MEFLTAGETVDLVAVHCRAEQALFGLLGGWAPGLADAEAKVVAVELADHAAWRARRWYELLPTAPPGPDAFLAPTDAEIGVFGFARAAGEGSDAVRLAVVAEALLPRSIAAMETHLAAASPVSQGPVRRILDIAITDARRDLDLLLVPFRRLSAHPGARQEADRAVGEVLAALDRTTGSAGV